MKSIALGLEENLTYTVGRRHFPEDRRNPSLLGLGEHREAQEAEAPYGLLQSAMVVKIKRSSASPWQHMEPFSHWVRRGH